jgi:hypothetical protein
MFFYMPGSYDNQTVDYAVISPLPVASVPLPDYLGFSSFWAQHFLENSSYGIYESIASVTIFKLNYHSAPILFVPLIMNYSINASLSAGSSYAGRLFSGNFSYLPPGEYQLEYTLLLGGSMASLPTADVYEVTSMSNGTSIPSSPVPVSTLQKNGIYVEYSIFQNFSSYSVLYQPGLDLNTMGIPLATSITVVSLEMKMVSLQRV